MFGFFFDARGSADGVTLALMRFRGSEQLPAKVNQTIHVVPRCIAGRSGYEWQTAGTLAAR